MLEARGVSGVWAAGPMVWVVGLPAPVPSHRPAAVGLRAYTYHHASPLLRQRPLPLPLRLALTRSPVPCSPLPSTRTQAWVRYAKFEFQNGEVALARRCYERGVEELGEDAQTVGGWGVWLFARVLALVTRQGQTIRGTVGRLSWARTRRRWVESHLGLTVGRWVDRQI